MRCRLSNLLVLNPILPTLESNYIKVDKSTYSNFIFLHFLLLIYILKVVNMYN